MRARTTFRLGSAVAAACVAWMLGPAAWADDVRVSVKGTTLVILGSAGADNVTVRAVTAPPGPVSLQVAPSGNTTVNGQAQAAVFDGVLHVRATLGSGNDELAFDAVSVDGKLTINGGPGDDAISTVGCRFGGNVRILGASDVLRVDVASTMFLGNLLVRSGPSDDIVTCASSRVEGNVGFVLGPGNNTFSDFDSGFPRFFLLRTGAGADTVNYDTTRIGAAARVLLSRGANTFVSRRLLVGQKLQIVGGRDDDSFQLLSTQVGDVVFLTLSRGTNNVVLDRAAPGATPCLFRGLQLTAGSGNDTFASEGSMIGSGTTLSSARLSMSTGDNLVFLRNGRVGHVQVTAGSGDDTVDFTGTVVEGSKRVLLDGGNNTGP